MRKKIAAFVLTGITIIGLSSAQVFAMGGGMGGGMGSGMTGSYMGGNQTGRGYDQSDGRSAGNYGYMHDGQSGSQHMDDEFHNEIANQHMGDAAGYMGVRPNGDQERDGRWRSSDRNDARWHSDQMGFGNNR